MKAYSYIKQYIQIPFQVAIDCKIEKKKKRLNLHNKYPTEMPILIHTLARQIFRRIYLALNAIYNSV